jgi:sulfatase maturation enzyme AslB (radical SAM superfamily)
MSAEPFVVMAKPAGPICNLACRYCYYLGKRALFPGARRTGSPRQAMMRAASTTCVPATGGSTRTRRRTWSAW